MYMYTKISCTDVSLVSGNASNISVSPLILWLCVICTEGTCFRIAFATVGYVTLTFPTQVGEKTSLAHGQLSKTSVLALCIFIMKNCTNMYCLSRRHNSMDIRQAFSKIWLMPCRLGLTEILACDHADMPSEVTNARAVRTVDGRCYVNMGALKRGNVIVLAYRLCFAEF